MSITVFVGDCDQSLSVTAKKYDSRAYLLSSDNYQDFLESTKQSITVYTSLADLPTAGNNKSVLELILERATQIYYCPPGKWSDASKEFSWASQRISTEFFLYLAKLQGKHVIGLDIHNNNCYLDLIEQRASTSPCLWVAGGSDSMGMGVDNNQRFGYLLGQKLNLPVTHLTKPSASIEYIADQILRSDIQSGDTIVWGLTPECRAPKAKNGKVVGYEQSGKFEVYTLTDETRLYKAVTSVYQVVNFCKKLKCNLLILPFYASELLQTQLLPLKEFYPMSVPVCYVDFGTDGIHPGPKQHQLYADLCYQQLTNLVP